MAASNVDSSMNTQFNTCLSIINDYMDEDSSVTAEVAQNAFKTLESFMNDNKSLRQISQDNLTQIKNIFESYLEKKPTHSKTYEAFVNIIGKGSKEHIARKYLPKIQIEVASDKDFKQFAVDSKIENLSKLPDQEMRIQLKQFIVELCQGNQGHPISMKEALYLFKTSKVENHSLIKMILDPELFSLYECKTGKLERPPRNLEQCVGEKLAAGNLVITPKHDTQAIVKDLQKQRLFALNNLKSVYERTLISPDQRVNSKFFPQTRSWFVGSLREEGKIPFEFEMQRIGKENDIPVITDSIEAFDQEKGRILSLEQSKRGSYPQDYVDFSQNEVRIPVVIDPGRCSEMQSKMVEERGVRDPDWVKPIGDTLTLPKDECLPLGDPMGKVLQTKAIELASALDATPVMSLTYSEGGNTLIGTYNDGSMYVIIGKDSYAVSKLLLEEDLGRLASEQEVKMAFAIDYGVSIDDLYFIEQPGDFHLDMNMAIIGDGIIAVNDVEWAREVFEPENDALRNQHMPGLTKEYVQTRGALALQQKKMLEDKAAADLEAQGFQVVRVPGRFEFEHYSRESKMNFFNMVTATTPNDEKIIIAMGVPSEKYVTLFMKMIEIGGVDVKAVYFLDPHHSEQSLQLHGGISCRAKTI